MHYLFLQIGEGRASPGRARDQLRGAGPLLPVRGHLLAVGGRLPLAGVLLQRRGRRQPRAVPHHPRAVLREHDRHRRRAVRRRQDRAAAPRAVRDGVHDRADDDGSGEGRRLHRAGGHVPPRQELQRQAGLAPAEEERRRGRGGAHRHHQHLKCQVGLACHVI